MISLHFYAGDDLIFHTRVARAPSPAKTASDRKSHFGNKFVEYVHSSLTWNSANR